MDVLVVGAGLAGLTAASRLTRIGLQVEVLEARDRVGGRVWSHTFEDGTVVELGGEWIDSSQRHVSALADELSLELVDTGQDFVSRDLIGAEPIPAREHDRLAVELQSRMRALGADELQGLTIAQVLDSLGMQGPAMTVLRSRLGGTFGVELTEMSAEDLRLEFGMAQASAYVRVKGGNDMLAHRLAGRVEVTLGVAVRSIARRGADVLVETDSGPRIATTAVVAVPLGVLKGPAFLQDPPPSLEATLRRLQMGNATKIAVPVSGEPPMFRRQEADIPGWYWTGRDSNGSIRRAVTGFAGTRSGADILAREAGRRVARAAPEVTASAAPIVMHWGNDPLARGCYSALRPGDRALLPNLARPWGGVVFAGEHVNGSGTIDGAVASGIEAASQVAELV